MSKHIQNEKQVVKIPLTELLPNTAYMNREELDVEDLRKSIKIIGQQIPIIVRRKGDGFQIISGFRRVKAIRELGIGFVWAEVREDISDKECHKISIVENVQRNSLSSIELVIGCKRMKEDGLSTKEISESFGRTMRTIQRWLRVAEASEETKQAIREGKISLIQAYECVRAGISVKDVVQKNLSVRDMRKLGLTEKNPPPIEIKWFKTGFHIHGRYNKNKHKKKELIETFKSVIKKLEDF